MQRNYKIIIEDESRLTKLAVFRTNKWLFSIITLVAICCMLILAMVIVMLTPLHTLLPGYMKEEQRMNTVATLTAVDSLQKKYEDNQRYLENLMEVLDLDRPVTSDSTISAQRLHPLPLDSLKNASKREQEFLLQMQDRERYNISVLAPMVAEGMEFSPISDGAVFEEATRLSTTPVLLISGANPIYAVTDGKIASVAYSPAHGAYNILILHNKGFASRYSGIGTPLAQEGEMVVSGQPIGMPNHSAGKDTNRITVEMWRNGVPLIPAKFLHRPVVSDKAEKEPVVDEDIGRGR